MSHLFNSKTKMFQFPLDVSGPVGTGNQGHYIMFMINPYKQSNLIDLFKDSVYVIWEFVVVGGIVVVCWVVVGRIVVVVGIIGVVICWVVIEDVVVVCELVDVFKVLLYIW